MRTTFHPSPIILWHHRVLGMLWGLFGLSIVGSSFQRDSWAEYEQWIVFILAVAVVVTAIGFFFGRTWARRTMGVLMVPVVLWFLDVMLLASFVGNRTLLWQIRIGLAAVAYTWVFLGNSASASQEDLQC